MSPDLKLTIEHEKTTLTPAVSHLMSALAFIPAFSCFPAPTFPFPTCPNPCSQNNQPVPEAILKRSCESFEKPVMALHSNCFFLDFSSLCSCVEVWSKQVWRLAVMGLSCRPLPRDDLGSQTMVRKQVMWSGTPSVQSTAFNYSKPLQTLLKACHGQPANGPS